MATWTRRSAGSRTGQPRPPSDTLSGGLAVAHRLGDGNLADAAQTAFVNGMHGAAIAAAAVALIGAVIAFVVIPAREAQPETEPPAA